MKHADTFIEKLYECNQHKKKLLTACDKLEKFIPFTMQKYAAITPELSSFIDQLIFRFSKLQDTMGDKLFPAILELMEEDVKSKPFIDRLNRLEELGLVGKNDWLALRKERNEIAHEYSFNQDEVVESINNIYKSTQKLLKLYDGFCLYCVNRFDFVANSPKLQ